MGAMKGKKGAMVRKVGGVQTVLGPRPALARYGPEGGGCRGGVRGRGKPLPRGSRERGNFDQPAPKRLSPGLKALGWRIQ